MRRCLYGMLKACRDLQLCTIGTEILSRAGGGGGEKVKLAHLLGGSGRIHPSRPSAVNSSGELVLDIL